MKTFSVAMIVVALIMTLAGCMSMDEMLASDDPFWHDIGESQAMRFAIDQYGTADLQAKLDAVGKMRDQTKLAKIYAAKSTVPEVKKAARAKITEDSAFVAMYCASDDSTIRAEALANIKSEESLLSVALTIMESKGADESRPLLRKLNGSPAVGEQAVRLATEGVMLEKKLRLGPFNSNEEYEQIKRRAEIVEQQYLILENYAGYCPSMENFIEKCQKFSGQGFDYMKYEVPFHVKIAAHKKQQEDQKVFRELDALKSTNADLYVERMLSVRRFSPEVYTSQMRNLGTSNPELMKVIEKKVEEGEFKGICGLELGSEMDVSKLKYDGWYRVFTGKVDPPNQFDKFTSCTVYVTAKTHRLYKIVSETEDKSIVKDDPRFEFDDPERPDPEFVKAVCEKYKVSPERSSNSGFVAMMGCPFQWQMHFGGERVMVVCRNSSLGYMGNTAAVVAIDERIQNESKTEGDLYEEELKKQAQDKGKRAASKDADAF